MKLIAFDTKSNGNYRTPIRNQQEIAKKSIAFDKRSVAFDTKSNGNYKQKKVSKNSLGNRYEFNSD